MRTTELREALAKARYSGLPADFSHPEFQGLTKVLANGNFGVVFENKSGTLTKFGHITRNEFSMSKKMAALGLGPKVYTQKYDKHCIKLEFVRGKKWDYFSPEEALLMFLKLVDLHRRRYFHLDVSPHNCNMLYDGEEIRFIDWGFGYEIGKRITREISARIREELTFCANYAYVFGYVGISDVYLEALDQYNTMRDDRHKVLSNFSKKLRIASEERATARKPNNHQLFLCYQSDDSHKKYKLVPRAILDAAYFTDLLDIESELSHDVSSEIDRDVFMFIKENFPFLTREEVNILTSTLNIVFNESLQSEVIVDHIKSLGRVLEELVDARGRSGFLQNYMDKDGKIIESPHNKYFHLRCALYDIANGDLSLEDFREIDYDGSE